MTTGSKSVVSKAIRGLLCYGVWLCALALASGHLMAYAQSVSPLPESRAGRTGLEGFQRAGRLTSTPSGDTFFEGTIDPAEYTVGPGDVLDVVFWQPAYVENLTPVNGEGDVIIPYVGLVPVGGVTLSEARLRIEDAVAKALRVGRVSISLVTPRRFRVHVTGLVQMPGTVVLPATARVADAIEAAGGFKRQLALTGRDSTIAPEVSQRRIELVDRDGRVTGHADLMLFLRSGSLHSNPLLRDGQTIHVPHVAGAGLQIGVFGAVNESGLFEYADGDAVRDALALGGGITGLADSSTVSVVSATGQRRTVDLRNADANAPLSPGDRVYVAGFPDTARTGSVTVSGEVGHPGGYPIISGTTTVSQVLELAGGLLPSAAAGSVRLIRHTPPELVEPERSRVMANNLTTRPEPAYPSDPGLAAEFSRWSYSTAVINMNPKPGKPGGPETVRLRDGDVLEIPRQPLGVRVLGFVNNAGEVEWKADEKLSYYLRQAGGANHGGWKSQTIVVKARNGSQVRWQKSLTIDPGDVVYVPARKRTTNLENVTQVLGVTAQLVSLYFVIQAVK